MIDHNRNKHWLHRPWRKLTVWEKVKTAAFSALVFTALAAFIILMFFINTFRWTW